MILGRINRSERGASLILAIGLTVVIGMLATTSFALITTSANGRVKLDSIRNRQYAADGAVESAIATVRGLGSPGPGFAACGPYVQTLNNVKIHVDCAGVPTLTTGGYLQRDVLFTSCLFTGSGSGSTCTDSTAIVRAQINYEMPSSSVTRTWVQSWSVNR